MLRLRLFSCQMEGVVGSSCCHLAAATYAQHAAQHWQQQLERHSLQVVQMLLKDNVAPAGAAAPDGQPLSVSILLAAWDALQWVRFSCAPNHICMRSATRPMSGIRARGVTRRLLGIVDLQQSTMLAMMCCTMLGVINIIARLQAPAASRKVGDLRAECLRRLQRLLIGGGVQAADLALASQLRTGAKVLAAFPWCPMMSVAVTVRNTGCSLTLPCADQIALWSPMDPTSRLLPHPAALKTCVCFCCKTCVIFVQSMLSTLTSHAD